MINDEARDLLLKADEIANRAIELNVADLLPRPWLSHQKEDQALMVEVRFDTAATYESVERMDERDLRNLALFIAAIAQEERNRRLISAYEEGLDGESEPPT